MRLKFRLWKVDGMQRIPEKYSLRWLRVFVGYFLIIYACVSFPQILFGNDIVLRPLLSLAMLSVGVSLIPCVAGCLGGRAFFVSYSLFAVFGALNMLNFAMLIDSTGWGDLRVYMVFLAFIAAGAGAGLLTQAVYVLYKYGEKRHANSGV